MISTRSYNWKQASNSEPEKNKMVIIRVETFDVDCIGTYKITPKSGAYVSTGSSTRIPWDSVKRWSYIEQKERAPKSMSKTLRPPKSMPDMDDEEYTFVRKSLSNNLSISEIDAHKMIRQYFNGNLNKRTSAYVERTISDYFRKQ